MPVDDFKYLPRSFAAAFQLRDGEAVDDVPFTPLARPMRQARLGLITTAGIWNRETDTPFDYEREKREPLWGDPSYRVLDRSLKQEQVGAGHLHLNNDDVLEDFNIALPIHRLNELVEAEKVGSVAQRHYSFMGFQGGGQAGADTSEWQEHYGPEVARRLLDEDVQAVILTPT